MSGQQNMEFQEDLVPKEEVEDIPEYLPVLDQEIKRELNEKDEHIRRLEAENQRLQEVERQSANEIGSLNEQLIAARAVQAPSDRRSLAANQLNQMNLRLTGTQQELTETQQELAETQQKLSATQQKLNETKQRLSETATKFNKADIELAQRLIDVDNAQNDAETAQKAVKKLEEKVKKLTASLHYEESTNRTGMEHLRGVLAKNNEKVASMKLQVEAEKKYNAEMKMAHQKAINEFLALSDKNKKEMADREAAHTTVHDDLYAQLLKERQQNEEQKEYNETHVKAIDELQTQVKKLENSYTEKELDLKIVRNELDTLATEFEALEKRLETEGEEKNEEILDLKKKLETTEKKWEKKLKTEGDQKNEEILNLKKKVEATEKKWEKKMKLAEEVKKLESNDLHKKIKTLETERTSNLQLFSNIQNQISERLQGKRDGAPQNEEATRKKRKCQQK